MSHRQAGPTVTGGTDTRLLSPFKLVMPPVPRALDIVARSRAPRLVSAGTFLQREGEASWSGVVESGLLRSSLSSATGRRTVVAYARPGSLLGVTSIFTPVAISTIEAVTDSVVYELAAGQLRREAQSDPALAMDLARLLEWLVEAVLGEVAAHAFGDMRSRIARHLLAMAEWSERRQRYDAEVTQLELADSIASSPDVVGRTIRRMAAEGLVSSSRGHIGLLHPERILAVASTL